MMVVIVTVSLQGQLGVMLLSPAGKTQSEAEAR
jgi:hypothetical protein